MDLTDIFRSARRQSLFGRKRHSDFLKHVLSELAQRRQLDGWPSDDLVDLLTRRAQGSSFMPLRPSGFWTATSTSQTPIGRHL